MWRRYESYARKAGWNALPALDALRLSVSNDLLDKDAAHTMAHEDEWAMADARRTKLLEDLVAQVSQGDRTISPVGDGRLVPESPHSNMWILFSEPRRPEAVPVAVS